jgi:hypothetical protein
MRKDGLTGGGVAGCGVMRLMEIDRKYGNENEDREGPMAGGRKTKADEPGCFSLIVILI